MNHIIKDKSIYLCYGKCSALWNKTSHCTTSADIVREKLNTCLVNPNATRWNSFYNAVDKIRVLLERTPDETMSDVFHALDVPMFTSSQVTFIREYCTVVQPLANALDILQGDQHMCNGYLLPTLCSLQNKLNALKPGLQFAASLVDAVLSGVAKLFAGYRERNDLIIATVSVPQFKLRWLEEPDKERARSLLYSHASCLNDSASDSFRGIESG